MNITLKEVQDAIAYLPRVKALYYEGLPTQKNNKIFKSQFHPCSTLLKPCYTYEEPLIVINKGMITLIFKFGHHSKIGLSSFFLKYS